MKLNLIPDLSICLVSRSGWTPLRLVLQSLYDYYGHVSLEFFVVELGGESSLSEKLGQFFPEVHIIEDPGSLNDAAAWNMAGRLARGRYLAFWNENFVCKADCLPNLVGFMDDTPDAGAVGPRLLGPAGGVLPSCFQFPLLKNMMYGALTGRNWREIRDVHENMPQEVGWLSNSALLVRREALDDVGSFDEGYGECYTDLDWCYRAGKVGWHTHYVPSAVVERIDCSEENDNLSPAPPPDWWGQVRGGIRSFRKKWTGTR